MSSLLVIGAGSWGSALAIHLARAGHTVWLWGRDPATMAQMATERYNRRYLPDTPLAEGVIPIGGKSYPDADAILIAVPSHAFRATVKELQPQLRETRLAWATKGFEQQSGKLLHQIIEEELGIAYGSAVISGPTFATEVAAGLPAAVTVAANRPELGQWWLEQLHTPRFRAYASDDLIGVELGGACKNVLAVAAGIADGLDFGANTRAALITRGLHEINRLGQAMGAKTETLMGLAGLGDLLLTCTDNHSRNRRVGLGLGRGEPLHQVIATIGQAVEGVTSAPEVVRLANRYQIEMPIAEQVYRVLYHNHPPQQAVEELLGRSVKREYDTETVPLSS
ncbi:NAD(P)-dependent glycerol-3-phosphate dehydrogenase [Ectothiorhodospiraceae bacterium BW-2]|nr:NAD(P)-dependent glycerol-3-phosphate dehydrogenase [Ectothiorhodospiraceae bacterium BW-2]